MFIFSVVVVGPSNGDSMKVVVDVEFTDFPSAFHFPTYNLYPC
jgi:hypothetical protein